MKINRRFLLLTFLIAIATSIAIGQSWGYNNNRIAISFDGNSAPDNQYKWPTGDPDDWGAIVASGAILAKLELQDKLVHCSYNNFIDAPAGPDNENQMKIGADGIIERWGFNKNVFFDVTTQLIESRTHLAMEMGKSTAADPLYFIHAGLSEFLYQAVEKAIADGNKEALDHVYLVSHSGFNENEIRRDYHRTWADVKILSENRIKYKKIKDQNDKDNPHNLWHSKEDFSVWYWMRDHQDPNIRWMYKRMQAHSGGHADISDCGMLFYLLVGDDNGTPEKFRDFIGDGINMNLQTTTSHLQNFRWTLIDAKGDVTGRHENSFIEYKGAFYLLGGRGINPVNVFDPSTNTWESKQKSPIEINHFQAVVYNDAIYLVGAMQGSYPVEQPLENIWIYYPETDKWEKGPLIPENRRRGGAGTVVYNDKIYMVGGIEYGHTSGTNNYFDSYDLKTGEWKALTKAPHIRDHFPAIVVNDKLYCVGGRNSSVHHPNKFGAFFDATIPYVDVYDFKKQEWYTLKEELPYPSAAGGVVSMDNKLIYMGGEGAFKHAYYQTQCLDLETEKWELLSPMVIGRHGSGAILYDNNIYVAAGSHKQGGANMNSIEIFSANHQWKSLFNGHNLDGWEERYVEKDTNKEYWTVDNGTILCDTKGNSDHQYMWLQTVDEFSDFELRLKFQANRKNKGNSGIQIRSRYDENAKVDGDFVGWMDGTQVDINPNSPWRNGLIYDETRNTQRWISPSLPSWDISKEEWAPKEVINYWNDEGPGWNDMRIVCKGMHITTYVNNIKVSDYDGTGVLDDEDHVKYGVSTKGHIAIQLHKGDSNLIRYKGIEIREL